MKSISLFKANKQSESKEFSIHPEDTCSAFMEKWATDLYNNYDHYKNLHSSGKTTEGYLVFVELLINSLFRKHMNLYVKSDYPNKNTVASYSSLIQELFRFKMEVTETLKRDNALNQKTGNICLEDNELDKLLGIVTNNISKEIYEKKVIF